jgi:hypothetical protein
MSRRDKTNKAHAVNVNDPGMHACKLTDSTDGEFPGPPTLPLVRTTTHATAPVPDITGTHSSPPSPPEKPQRVKRPAAVTFTQGPRPDGRQGGGGFRAGVKAKGELESNVGGRFIKLVRNSPPRHHRKRSPATRVASPEPCLSPPRAAATAPALTAGAD